MNRYGFAGGDPVNFSDPFGLCVPWPGCALAAASVGAEAGTTVGAIIGTFVEPGGGTLAGAGIGNRVGWVAGAATATAGAIYLAGRHGLGVNRVKTSLGIADEHLQRATGMPPDDDDPNFLKDMADHAQKHLNNAKSMSRMLWERRTTSCRVKLMRWPLASENFGTRFLKECRYA